MPRHTPTDSVAHLPVPPAADELADLDDEVVEAAVPAQAHGKRLDLVVAALVPHHSRSHLQALIEEGAVTVDGQAITTPSRKVQAGQCLRIEVRPTAQSQAFVPEVMPLDVVFEDAHLLVVNKPAGLVVHPAAGNWRGTLMNGLLAHHAGAADLPRAGIVHRLDKDTSGLMVVAKTWAAMTALVRAIAEREVSRQYLALAHGQWQGQHHIDAPIGRDPAVRTRMAVVASGKPAQTDVTVLQSAAIPELPTGLCAVHCVLHTGRTHQIRVHLSQRGHPLLADALYGGRPALGLNRQALHAARLAFAHPHTGTPMAFVAPLPTDLAHVWAQLAWPQPTLTTPGASRA
ncbi:RluA family pseudouridine synthase [Aquabacterium fontiphilum]|jgi:23S rRNA pseudouridine1911/1915/1917 synthase|uniref:RluA family pseudouridine synthase n=1 Tax=Aquabacterium fontiphilum TaxID=450365 RepID=UPI0013773A25|nr:RluA family pseudouridine synthase [Aquabacterium fontiphilum]NBD21523.1 RluA family pseudouridine synthase [Aquabacterium fontiphilum]